MPQAPTCKVCGTTHWSGEPHVFADSAPSKKAAKPAVEAVARVEPRIAAPVALDLAAYLAAEKVRKAAYMRDYRARTKKVKAP